MYKKKQHFVGHKTPYNKPRKQSNSESPRVNNQFTQDTRYTPTPVQGHPVARISLFRLESENQNWTIQGKDPGLTRHSPDSALTVSSNGSSLSFKYGLQSQPEAPPMFRRSQSIPNLLESTGTQSFPDELQPTPPITLEHPKKIPDAPGMHRTNSLRKVGPPQKPGSGNIHQGKIVRFKVGPYDNNDASSGVMEPSSLVKDKYKSEPNILDPEVNKPVRNNDRKQPFSIRMIEMKKKLGMFGFVLSCKYVLDDPLTPKELRCFPRIDTVSVEGVAHRSGIRQGLFVLEINGQSVELSSINRCNSLLQMCGDHLQLKVASNNQTNHPAAPQRPINPASNFSRKVPSSDLPRHRVRYRESALQKRMAAAHPSHRMKRSSSTPNLADDNHNHIYEELKEFVWEKDASATTLPVELGKSGRDASEVGGIQSSRTPQKTLGRTDNTQNSAGRPDNTQKNAGRPDKTMDTGPGPKKNSVDSGVGSGKLPPARPQRLVAGSGGQEKSQVTRVATSAATKRGERKNNAINRGVNPAKFETKIVPGVGSASVVSVHSSSSATSSISEVPMKLSSFTGPFKDGAHNTRAITASNLSHDSSGTHTDDGSRSKPTSSYLDNKAGMLVAERSRGRDTSATRSPGNTCLTMDTDGPEDKSTSGSQNNKVGVLVTHNGSISQFYGDEGRATDTDDSTHNATAVSTDFGNHCVKSEFISPQTFQEKQRIALTQKEEPSSLLYAIRQHPLVHNDRFRSTDLEENSTVVPPSRGANVCMKSTTKHAPQKNPPPPPPPPKSKPSRSEALQGTVNYDPCLGRSSSETHDLKMHPTMSDSEVKSLRQLKLENRDCGRKNDLKLPAENKTGRGLADQRIQEATKIHLVSPPTMNKHEKKGDVLMNALKSSNDPEVNGHNNYNSSADSSNRRQRDRSESHLTQMLHLDGATVDQSYSENRATDESHIQKQTDPGSTKPEPVFRFHVSTGMLLLSDATVDQSCTDSDLITFLPPPPLMEFSSVTSPDTKFHEIRSQDTLDSFWGGGTESSGCSLSPYIDRSLSIDNDSVFSEIIESPPPPPVLFIDPEDNAKLHESRSLMIAASRAKVPHSMADKDILTNRFRSGNNLPHADSSARVPLPPSDFQSDSVVRRFNSHLPPPEPEFKNQWSRTNGTARRQKPSEGFFSDWSTSDVADWLCGIGLGQYAPSFMSHCVDGQRLSAMTRSELIELGVNEMNHRRDIERGVLRLKHLIST